ncbi:VIT domain-containing protein [Undibacterium sp. SXout7W]|uniref:VIT domain-containing protein n=1 Tax=Undibacterium sp. SXout7W TaxID=3413049 RepID=UPI003BF3878A
MLWNCSAVDAQTSDSGHHSVTGKSILPSLSPRSPLPLPLRPVLVVPEARIPVRLDAVQVRTDIVGGSAHSVVELTFYNPNDRALEGQLEFPLSPGQQVSGLALDIGGKLRSAVAVDKARGQQVFEDVSRARVDPALLEATQGNHYRVRVYPLPAKGRRTVQLQLDELLEKNDHPQQSRQFRQSRQSQQQPLPQQQAHWNYRLPLQLGQAIGRLDVAIHLHGVRGRQVSLLPASGAALMGPSSTLQPQKAPPQMVLPTADIGWQKREDAEQTLLQWQQRDLSPAARLPQIMVTAGEQPLVQIQPWQGASYFYADVPIAARATQSAARAVPKRLALLWDASGSGAGRDHERELAALDAYFATMPELDVQLVIGRDQAEPVRNFTIRKGQWQPLRQLLQSLNYDGASNAAALVAPAGCELALLFSDGMMNYGSRYFTAAPIPTYALLASTSADVPALRGLAENSGAQLLDLFRLSPAQIVTALRTRQLRLTGVVTDQITQVVTASVYPEQGRFRIAGLLNAPSGQLVLQLETPQGKTLEQRLTVATGDQQRRAEEQAALLSAVPVAPRWASLQLAQLQQQQELNRAAIRRLGRQFSLPTSETSLLVLDSVQDYVRYDIVPPLDLLPEYERLSARKTSEQTMREGQHLEKILMRFNEKQQWWDKVFPQDQRPQPLPKPAATSLVRSSANAAANSPVTASPAPLPMLMEARVAAVPVPTSAPATRDANAEAKFDAGNQSNNAGGAATIRLKKWEPDAAYYRRLQEASPTEMERIYFDERPSYTDSSAFFLDAADLFLERGQTATGLRILSNLAEMQLDQRQILRLLAYRLLQAQQPALAIPVLQQVVRLSPEEPQSYRDLGLALAAAGQPQAAIDQLWHVVSHPWHDRFPDIELIALAEMNAIIARQPATQPLDTTRIDSRFLRHLPLDLRAVLSWDADNTDIDLWVTDPNGEKTYFAAPLSYQGGRISRDFTGGYGPEEFSLHHAKPGKYRVEAQFYGHTQQILAGATTLMLRLSTGFGTDKQVDQLVVLRLKGRKDSVVVGEFEIAASVSASAPSVAPASTTSPIPPTRVSPASMNEDQEGK